MATLLLLAGLLPAARACGFTIHQAVTHRAVTAFFGASGSSWPSLFAANRGALEAGSPYPDYGYECGPNHDDGEYTHWAPYFWQASNWLRATYGTGPYNQSGQTIAAFLAGAVSHGIADISWHGLAEVRQDYGMIQTIGFLDFNCTGLCDRAHGQADTGGEFVAAYATGFLYDPEKWVIPVNDLVSILRYVNRTVETGHMGASDIDECAVIFFTGAEAIRAVAALAEPLEIAPSPTFGEELVGLPCGGLDDMAVYASRLWQRWGAWIEQGPPPTPPGGEYCPGICSEADRAEAAGFPSPRSVVMTPEQRSAGQRDLKHLYRLLGPALIESGLVTVSHDAAAGTLLVGNSADATRELRSAAVLTHLRRLLNGTVKAEGAAPAPLRGLDSPRLKAGWTAVLPADVEPAAVARLLLRVLRDTGAGAALDALGHDGNDANAIALALRFLDEASRIGTVRRGAPQLESLAAPLQPSTIFASSLPLEYAGTALVAGDFDGDGTADIVATAPGHSAVGSYGGREGSSLLPQRLPQSGAFYVRYGNLSLPSTSDPQDLPDAFPFLTEGDRPYMRLGAAACVLDFNSDGTDDLAVSAPAAGWDWVVPAWGRAPDFPYVGAVLVYFGARGDGLSLAPDVVLRGPENNTHTGQHLECADVNGDSQRDLLIGSPMAIVSGTGPTEGGRLDVFFASRSWATGVRATLTAANLTLSGTTQGEWLGYSTAVATNGAGFISSAEVTELLLANTPAAARRACAAHAVAASAEPTAAATLLVVGQPGYKAVVNGGLAAVGRISGFAIPNSDTAAAGLAACLADAAGGAGGAAPAPLFTVTVDLSVLKGALISAKLGHGLALGEPYGAGQGTVLAMGMTAVDLCNSSALVDDVNVFNSSAGSVTLVTVGPALRGDLAWTALGGASLASALNTTVLASNQQDSRYGWRLGFVDLGGDGADELIVGAPMRTPFFLGAGAGVANDTGHEAGLLLAYQGGAAFPFAGAPVGKPGAVSCGAVAAAALTMPGQAEFGRFGSSFLLAKIEGTAARPMLLVGAPRVTEVVPPGENEVAARRAQVAPSTALEMPGAIYAFEVS